MFKVEASNAPRPSRATAGAVPKLYGVIPLFDSGLGLSVVCTSEPVALATRWSPNMVEWILVIAVTTQESISLVPWTDIE